MDDQRFQRNNAYLIHVSLVGTKAAANMYSALPLPFDNEIEKQDKQDEQDMQSFYEETVRQWELNKN